MRIIQLIGAILLLIATPAMAKGGGSGDWIVTQRSGQVQVIRSGLQPASLHARAALAPGDLISTGPDGRATLTRGGDYIVVAPDSRLQLPNEQQAGGFTRLIQQIGTLFYKVRHTGDPRFAVEAPMLAAVVKGTSFTVIVDKDRNAVQVTEGVVEVSSAAGNAPRLVHGGVTVVVSRDRPQEIVEVKPGSVRLPSSDGSDGVTIEGSGDVPLSTITDLTGGLVSEAPLAVLASTTIASTATVTAAQETTPTAPDGAGSTVAQPPAEDVGTVTEPVEEAADTVSKPVEEVVDTVSEPVEEVVDTVSEPVEEVVDTVSEPVEEVVDTVSEPVEEVVEEVVEVVEEPVVEVVEEVVDPVEDLVEIVEEPVVEVVEEVEDSPLPPLGL